MAYTTINKPTDHFNTKLYSGNGSTQSITGVGFQPDWVWIKSRNNSGVNGDHFLQDSVRGATISFKSNSSNAEFTQSNMVTSFDSNGFSLGNEDEFNRSGTTFTSWNWKAGGTAPAITYSVKVVSDSGNKYRFDDFGTSAVTLDLQEGGVYTFDQSDSSNSGHPLRFSTTSNGTHGGGTEYTTGVVVTGTPGNAGAKTVITVAASAPTLYYYCTQHSGMGGQANTNSTFGSSNFGGNVQSTVSANTTAGFSIVSYTGDGGATATFGHALGAIPKMIFLKKRNGTNDWVVYHEAITYANRLKLNTTDASASSPNWRATPTSSVFNSNSSDIINNSGDTYIAYCFTEKTGYSKFGTYVGNGNADGTFVYTGFKPAFTLIKRTNSADNWAMHDNKRNGRNPNDAVLRSNLTDAEYGGSQGVDYLSNGFKARQNDGEFNNDGSTYIYMAFAEAPLVGSNNIPCTAR